MITPKVKYPARSTAAKTEMLTMCKGCRKDNDNGYQYCSACNHSHRALRKNTIVNRRVAEVAAPSTVTREPLLASAEKFEIDWNLGK
jgi:hypothetical protein